MKEKKQSSGKGLVTSLVVTATAFVTVVAVAAVLLLSPFGSGTNNGTTNNGGDAVVAGDRSTMGKFSNALWEAPDPYTILVDGYYYTTYANSGNKIVVTKSDTLLSRGEPKVVYEFPSGQWNSCAVWGPEALFQWDDGRWYLYYCAMPGDNLDVYGPERRMGVLRSLTDDPQGEYEDLSADKPINTGGCWAIGAVPFKATDGKWYLTWSGLKGTDSMFPQCTYIAPMISPSEIGDRVLISEPEHWWETSVAPIQEGQTVFVKGDQMFLFYSGNASWTEEYCLGMLVYQGGDVLDPKNWVKQPDPVLLKTNEVRGPGGACVVPSKDGTEYFLMYHTTNTAYGGWGKRFTNMLKVSFDEKGWPVFGDPIPHGVLQDIPSGDPGRLFTETYDNTWLTSNGFHWTCFGGKWRVEGGGTGRRNCVLADRYSKMLADPVWTDNFELRTTVMLDEGDLEDGTAGVLFRITRATIAEIGYYGYYVALSLEDGTISIIRGDGDKETVLASANMNVEAYMDYDLVIRAEGSNISVSLDGEDAPLVTAVDATYSEGTVGIRAYQVGAQWGQFKLERLK